MFSLRINNFRGFLDTNFNFKKINILIGENSSGKSSLIKFLLAVKQSLENPNYSNFLLNGDHVDLGNYENMIYNNEKSRLLEFTIGFDGRIFERLDRSIRVNFLEEFGAKTNVSFSHNVAEFFVDFQISKFLDKPASVKTRISNSSIGELTLSRKSRKNKENKYIIKRACDLEFFDKEMDRKIKLHDVAYSQTAFMSYVSGIDLFEQLKKKYPKEFPDLFYKIGMLLIIQNEIESIFTKFEYLNPILTKPNRYYYKNDIKNVYPKNDLEKVITFNTDKRNVKNKEVINRKLSKFLKMFNITEDIQIKSSKTFPITEVSVKIQNKWRNITDVGYGVALQLPIIYEAIKIDIYNSINKKNDVTLTNILIEQPEVHLHPELQAKLIEGLVKECKNNSYIIETHSEHIVRKLQSIVKNNPDILKPEDVAIYYFTKGKDSFKIEQHTIDEEGFLTPDFPSGFFDQSYKLVEELLD